MKEYVCDGCDYVYDPEKGDPENGIEPGTSFEDLPEDWVCPVCGLGKDSFSLKEERGDVSRDVSEQALAGVPWTSGSSHSSSNTIRSLKR